MPRKTHEPWREQVARALSQKPSLGSREARAMLAKAAVPFSEASVSNLLKNLKRKRKRLQERMAQTADPCALQPTQHRISDVEELARINRELRDQMDELRAQIDTERKQHRIVLEQRDALQQKLGSIRELLGPSDA